MGEGISIVKTGQRSDRGSVRIANREKREQVMQERASSPSPTQRADMDSRKFKSAITRAHNYTQDNFHQVASATAAKAFGYNDLEKGFRDIEREHDAAGSLSAVRNGLERVQALEDEMEKRIRRDYGQRGIDAWNRAKS